MLPNKNMKILIVDDVYTVRKILLKHLNSLGFSLVFQAEDGLEAWNTMINNWEKGEPFDFVICDCNMPKMDGFEFLEKVRNDQKFKNIPFLMMAADSDQKSVIKTVRLGANEFLVKPVNQDILQSKIQKIFSVDEDKEEVS